MKGLKPQKKRLMDDPEVQQALSPEQMEQYRKALGMGMVALYDDKFMSKAEVLIQKSPSPAAGIGDVVSMIGARIYKAAKEKGELIAPDVLPLAGMDLVREVAEFAEKFADVQVTPEVIEQAFLVASDGLRMGLGKDAPDVSPQAQAAMQGMDPAEADMMAKQGMQARLPQKANTRRGLGGTY